MKIALEKKKWPEKIRNIVFYLMLGIELWTMVVEKSNAYAPYDSYIFRLTFGLAVLTVALTAYTLRQWILIAVFSAALFWLYRYTGCNDLLRLAMFIFACKDMDKKEVVRVSFYVCLIGFIGVALLAFAGILGDVRVTGDYGRSVGIETRYVLGFGHPNTLHSSFYALLLMAAYLFENDDPDKSLLSRLREGHIGAISKKNAPVIMYLILAVLNILLYIGTRSRTGGLTCMFFIVVMMLIRYADRSGKGWKFFAIAGEAVFAACIAFSVWSAVISRKTKKDDLLFEISRIFNHRILNLHYDTKKHKGAIKSWSLFAENSDRECYFDMGWVRLFYWYGIIPAAVIVALAAVVIWLFVKKRDYAAFVMVVSLSIYTVVEATFVSRYIGRCFFLPVAAAYLWELPFINHKKPFYFWETAKALVPGHK